MKPLCIFLLLSLFTPSLYAQTFTLNWASSFSAAWTSGNTSGSASDVGGSGANATVAISKSGGVYSHSNGNSGVSTPTVSGSSFIVGGSSSNLEIAMGFDNNTEYTDIVYQFSSHVTHLSFEIADIDKPSATSNAYLDEVVITGSDGAVTYLPTLTKYDATSDPDFLVISGNAASADPASGKGGNSASTLSDQKGTVIVNFGSTPITKVTIRYQNATGAQSNPPDQGIAVGNLSFQKSVILPVSFTNVTAKAEANQTVILWETAIENNNNYFEIEKSTNGQLWTKIGMVHGKATSSIPTDYSFSDPVIQTGTAFYRIMQVDLDGRRSYSEIASVTRTHEHFKAKVYPNPVDASSVISFYTDHDDEVKFTLIDIGGRTVKTDVWPVFKGTNELSLARFPEMHKGHYVLHLISSKTGYSASIKLLKL